MAHIGILNRRIIIEKATSTSDGAGGRTVTWATDKTVWAEIRQISPKRLMEAGKQFQGTPYEITVRYDAVDITNIGEYRINNNSNYYTIHSIENIEDKNTYKLILASG